MGKGDHGLVTGHDAPPERLAHLATTLDFPNFTAKAAVVQPYLAIAGFRGVVGDVGDDRLYRLQALHGARGVLFDARQTTLQCLHPRGGGGGGGDVDVVDVRGGRSHHGRTIHEQEAEEERLYFCFRKTAVTRTLGKRRSTCECARRLVALRAVRCALVE